MIVNDVAGFIGPEVFRTGAQLERACLEDIGDGEAPWPHDGPGRVCDVSHGHSRPRSCASCTARIVGAAAPAYLMAVAGNADPMLGYLTTSFREHPDLRSATRRRTTTSMDRRLHELGVSRLTEASASRVPRASQGCTHSLRKREVTSERRRPSRRKERVAWSGSGSAGSISVSAIRHSRTPESIDFTNTLARRCTPSSTPVRTARRQ